MNANLTALQPIWHRDDYGRGIERKLNDFFADVVFKPIDDFLQSYEISADLVTRENAVANSLIEAIRSGRVTYADGVFSGTFSAGITSDLRNLGASWRPSSRTFRIDPNRIPYDLRGILAGSESRTKEIVAALIALLLLIRSNAASAETGLHFDADVDVILGGVSHQIAEAVARVKGLKRPAVMVGTARTTADQLKAKIDLLVKIYLEKRLRQMAEALRKALAESAALARLLLILRRYFGIFKRYSGIIGRNESTRIVSNRVEAFARAIGSRAYIWNTRRDWRVRPTPDYPLGDHRSLEGKTFLWDAPPVTIPGTGHTAHPGEDIECRCAARILIPTPAVS